MGLSYKGLLLRTVNPSILVRVQVDPQNKFFENKLAEEEGCIYDVEEVIPGRRCNKA